MNNGYYKKEMAEKELHIFPVDLSTLFKDSGGIKTRLLKRKARMSILNSSPIVNPAILEVKNILSVSGEGEKTYEAASIMGVGKSILVEASFTDAEISAVTDEASLVTLINSKNNLIYISSALSIFSENVIDIYFSKSEDCFIVAPELSLLGAVLPENEFLLDIAGWKVGLLKLAGLQSDFNFSGTIPYRPLPDIKIDHPSLAIAEAKAGVTVSSMLLQGLATFPYISEYMRHSSNGDVNMLKDTPIQFVQLNIDTIDMFVKDEFDHNFVIQATPFTYKLQQINNVKCKRIAFPIFF